MGATLVYFHSSFLVVGNPSSAKRSMAVLRIERSHAGSLAARFFSSAANWAKYRSCFSLTAVIDFASSPRHGFRSAGYGVRPPREPTAEEHCRGYLSPGTIRNRTESWSIYPAHSTEHSRSVLYLTLSHPRSIPL